MQRGFVFVCVSSLLLSFRVVNGNPQTLSFIGVRKSQNPSPLVVSSNYLNGVQLRGGGSNDDHDEGSSTTTATGSNDDDKDKKNDSTKSLRETSKKLLGKVLSFGSSQIMNRVPSLLSSSRNKHQGDDEDSATVTDNDDNHISSSVESDEEAKEINRSESNDKEISSTHNGLNKENQKQKAPMKKLGKSTKVFLAQAKVVGSTQVSRMGMFGSNQLHRVQRLVTRKHTRRRREEQELYKQQLQDQSVQLDRQLRAAHDEIVQLKTKLGIMTKKNRTFLFRRSKETLEEITKLQEQITLLQQQIQVLEDIRDECKTLLKLQQDQIDELELSVQEKDKSLQRMEEETTLALEKMKDNVLQESQKQLSELQSLMESRVQEAITSTQTQMQTKHKEEIQTLRQQYQEQSQKLLEEQEKTLERKYQIQLERSKQDFEKQLKQEQAQSLQAVEVERTKMRKLVKAMAQREKKLLLASQKNTKDTQKKNQKNKQKNKKDKKAKTLVAGGVISGTSGTGTTPQQQTAQIGSVRSPMK